MLEGKDKQSLLVNYNATLADKPVKSSRVAYYDVGISLLEICDWWHLQPKQVTIREKKANFQLKKPQMALANPSLSAHLLFIMILSQKEHLARSVCRLNLCALGNFRPAMHTEKGFPSCGLWAASWGPFRCRNFFCSIFVDMLLRMLLVVASRIGYVCIHHVRASRGMWFLPGAFNVSFGNQFTSFAYEKTGLGAISLAGISIGQCGWKDDTSWVFFYSSIT